MRVLLSVLGVLILLSVVPPARNLFSRTGCSTGFYNCRMACKKNEYAVRYCKNWTICCKIKKSQLLKEKKVVTNLMLSSSDPKKRN
ncbi:beta-defensin 43 [Marmota flaviventris]|uniref:beta-defensin 43 n=1 Tax=Marmota flaviventris TaxID=93162 RepID=UPI003A8A2E7F